MLQHMFGSREQDATKATADRYVRFDAATAVKAIVFHLIDENLAKSVAPDTVRRTVERLTAKSFGPSILRSKWTGMTNSQRLEWLLTTSDTLTLAVSDEVVSLKARRSR